MALVEVCRESAVAGKRVDLRLLLPEVGEPPYPCLYLLHGLTGDSRSWLRNSLLEFHVSGLPLIVVMPDGYRSWYTRNGLNEDYGRYVAEETVDFVDRFFPTVSSRAGRHIAGLSMGGYGALRLALRHSERFESASSHSGALIPWEREPALLSPEETAHLFGDSPNGSEHDLLAAAQLASPPPRLLFDCGLEDTPWLEINRKVHRHLSVDHEYREYPGGHDWAYWEARLPGLLNFHLQR